MAARKAGALDLGLGVLTKTLVNGPAKLAKLKANSTLSLKELYRTRPSNTADEIGAGVNLLGDGVLEALIERKDVKRPEVKGRKND